MISIACFNSYMGKDESRMTQLRDTIGFLLQWRRLVYKSKRNIIESLSLLHQKKVFDCDYLYMTEIMPEDQEKVDILLETWGYKEGVWGKSGSKTPLSSVLATKHPSRSIALPQKFVESSRGYGGFICQKHTLPIIGVHFAVTKTEQQKMRNEIMPLILSLVEGYKAVVLLGDFNQSYKTIKKILLSEKMVPQGTCSITHKVIGRNRTRRNLDNIILLTKKGEKPRFRLSKHKLHRGRSDHALLMTTLQ